MEPNVGLGNSNVEPRDDMEFDTHEAAYEFYKEYAKSEGFGTAKLSSRRSRATKEFIDAKFSCIRYGNKQQSDDAINPRPSPKIGCKASMHVKKRSSNGKWYIHSFIKEHNHELLPAQVHFFRSHRNVDPLNNDAKVRRKKMLAPVSKQYVAYQFSGNLENLFRNQNDRGRSLSLEEGDAQILLELFVHMQEENPRFFYAVDLNEEHRLRNVVWVDAKGIDSYSKFGDVVSFDTTYFTNKYKIPLVLFIGANHHVQPTLLGCALIADETVHTLIWLMRTWCLAMGGRGPRILLSDQNDNVKAAVGAVLPDTQLYFSLWSILEKIPRCLDYLSMWHELFMAKFSKCIYKSWTEEQFEHRWWKLIEKFNLREDEWVQSLYEDRKLWVPSFMRDVSFASLSMASRTESLNSFFDKYIQSETSLRDFIGQHKLILEDWYEEEAKANFDAWHEMPELKTPSPFEKQMLLIYTHEIFKKFQVEVLGAAACHLKKESEDGTSITYSVKDFDANQDFMVEWDAPRSDICCSCHSFEYKGYLCRHAIVVLQMSGLFNIPSKYILQRWTNVATSRCPIGERLDDVQAKVRRYNDLCRRAIILGEEGSLTQESYNIAVGALKEALKQCATVNVTSEANLRSGSTATLAIQDVDEQRATVNVTSEVNLKSGSTATHAIQDVDVVCQGNTSAAREPGSCSKAAQTSKGSKRADPENEMAVNNNTSNKKGKVPLEPDIANSAQGVFEQMDMPGSLDYHPARFMTTLLRGGDINKRGAELLGQLLQEQN
ncbi:Protein FAR1-RELATED SEQUENCE 4 [Capsicum baccatum]|uniref:Protein FAR1-RELATED SEQUENCE n=1 Tax=Capsicum baccatum TaxID=33114 RepID=A0A2G2V8U4_CAPBA|nr:Protein FAR1-RELATED SEQUENCE 4 [Capsicum baccatum]